MTSNILANEDIHAFVKTDIRAILDHRPEYQQEILATYRDALPQNQPIFKSLIAEIDPAVAKLLYSNPSQ